MPVPGNEIRKFDSSRRVFSFLEGIAGKSRKYEMYRKFCSPTPHKRIPFILKFGKKKTDLKFSKAIFKGENPSRVISDGEIINPTSKFCKSCGIGFRWEALVAKIQAFQKSNIHTYIRTKISSAIGRCAVLSPRWVGRCLGFFF